MTRPVVRGEVSSRSGRWEPVWFLVDTGADRTVLCAAVFRLLGFDFPQAVDRVGGVGGTAESVPVETTIRLFHDAPGIATFRGEYAGLTDLESLDMNVLGRDILGLFAVIVDRPGRLVTLIRQRHQYAIAEE